MYQLLYSTKALKDLKKMTFKMADRITKKIRFFANQEDIKPFCKKLQGFVVPTYRFRVGEYRVIFDLSSSAEIQILTVLRIKDRKDIYEL